MFVYTVGWRCWKGWAVHVGCASRFGLFKWACMIKGVRIGACGSFYRIVELSEVVKCRCVAGKA
jgi:hypothetical protein